MTAWGKWGKRKASQRGGPPRAAACVHQITNLNNIEAFFARLVGNGVQLKRLEV